MNSVRRGIHEAADAAPISRYTSYDGDDPYIVQMLDAVSFDKTTPDYSQFGSSCIPVSISSRSSQVSKPSSTKKRRSKPSGVLVASFDEHVGAVNSLAVAPDHQFFVSGSDDGSIKIWDTYRLEKNVTNRAVFTYKCNDPAMEDLGSQLPVRVICLCFIHSTYTVAAGLSDGTIRLLKMELSKSASGPRYRKLSFIGQHKLCEAQNEYPVDLQCVKSNGRLLLYAITTRCHIVVLDLADFTTHVMTNPLRHGLITSLVIDRKHNWLVVGTSLGILDLWDLRFELHVRSVVLPGGHPVAALALHPKSSGKWICVAGGTHPGEVTLWDIESFQCKEIYRQAGAVGNGYPTQYKPSSEDQPLTPLLFHDLTGTGGSINCLTTGLDVIDAGDSSGKRAFLFTGSSDYAVRFWDLHAGESSTIVSGLRPDAGKPLYTVSYPDPHLKLVSEKLISPNQKSDKQARSSVMSSELADLSRSHQSSVLCVCQLAKPYDMIVSADRNGVIKIFK
jgi:phosphoinositide-3-kinase regulatory subunit 4